jgi:hypothetical protein
MQNQLYEGKYVIDLEEGEFLCPTVLQIRYLLLIITSVERFQIHYCHLWMAIYK